jgi:glucose/arabinose dehydrogenase
MGHHRVATGFRRSVIAGLSVMLLGLGPASMAAPMDPASTDAATTTAPPSQTAPLEETTAPGTETTAPGTETTPTPITETTAPATETSPTTETTAPATETTAPARRGPTDAADPLTLSGEGSADTSDVFGTAEVSTLAAGLPTGFTEETAFSGLNLPTMVRFSPDGRVFVVEKRGMVLAFDSLSDPTPKTVINLTGLTYGWADRGMHGMVLDPSFPTEPYMYLLYASDPLGWGDTCPNPPGGTIDGCVANARLTRIQISGTNDVVGGEQVLLSGFWCQQYPSHSIGQLEFGSDGALYVSAGDGASFTFADYGQGGGSSGSPTPENPCGDPPVPVGGDQQPPTAEGGALRSQDLRTAGDPVSFDGAILRIDSPRPPPPRRRPRRRSHNRHRATQSISHHHQTRHQRSVVGRCRVEPLGGNQPDRQPHHRVDQLRLALLRGKPTQCVIRQCQSKYLRKPLHSEWRPHLAVLHLSARPTGGWL